MPEFRLGRIPVRIHPVFFLLAGFLGLQHTRPASILVFVALVLVSVLWHELGHAVAFRAFGYDSSILLHGMGGLTMPVTDRPLPPAKDLAVSLAGPVAGIAVGLAALLLGDPSFGSDSQAGLVDVALADAVWVNLGWGVLNLVPILPLDGGRVMASLIDLATKGRGARPARYVSIGVGLALGALALMNGLVFGALLLGWFVYSNVQDLQRLVPPPSPESLAGGLAEGWEDVAKGAFLAASNRGREALRWATEPSMRIQAATLLGWALLLDGKVNEGAAMLAAVPPGAGDVVLHPAVVAGAGGVDRALELLGHALQAAPGNTNAVALVRALLEAGRLDDALALMENPVVKGAGSNPAAAVGLALFHAGRFEDAARLGEATFERDPHPMLAYNVACSWARSGQEDKALEWLNRGIDTGYSDLAGLDADPDFASIRAVPAFAAARARLAPAEPRTET